MGPAFHRGNSKGDGSLVEEEGQGPQEGKHEGAEGESDLPQPGASQGTRRVLGVTLEPEGGAGQPPHTVSGSWEISRRGPPFQSVCWRAGHRGVQRWTDRQMDAAADGHAGRAAGKGRAEHFNECAQPAPSPQHPRRSRWCCGRAGRGFPWMRPSGKAKDFEARSQL